MERVEATLIRSLNLLSDASARKASLIEPQVLNQSDVTLINFSLTQTSRAALKLVKATTPLLTDNDLHILDEQIVRIRRLLERLRSPHVGPSFQPRVPLGLNIISSESLGDHSQQAELVFESTECVLHPFMHFDFVGSSGLCELLAGAQKPRSSLMLIDFNATTASPHQREDGSSSSDRTLSDARNPVILRSNIHALRQVTDELRIKGDNVASMQIVAVVQHAFTCAFPIPISRAHDTSACPWSATHASTQDQLELLKNLFAIAKTFLDASLRLLPSHFCRSQDPASDPAIDYHQSLDDLDGARTITFACIVAVFDAVVSSGIFNRRCDIQLFMLNYVMFKFPDKTIFSLM